MKKLAVNLKEFTRSVKRELTIYRLVMKDERTPIVAKALLWLALGYLLLPFDIIPDFIPVIGQIDDVIIVPALIYFALKLIPNDLVNEYRHSVT